MYLEIARFRIKPGAEDRFIEITKLHMLQFEKFAGANRFEFHRCVENPNEFYYLIDWNSIEDHVVTFRQSEFGKKAHVELVSLFDGEPSVHHTVLAMERRA